MIAIVEGDILEKEPTHLIVLTKSGLGYEIKISLNTYSSIPDEGQVRLFTHLAVREDAQVLYGFNEFIEKQMFLALIGISGVGPNTALMVLSSMKSEDLTRAIINEDVNALKSVKGVGAKSAQRMILELKDKLSKIIDGKLEQSAKNFSLAQNNKTDEALSALITLGLPKANAQKSISQVLRDDDSLSTEEIIKKVLKKAY